MITPKGQIHSAARLPDIRMRRTEMSRIITGLTPSSAALLIEELYFGGFARDNPGGYVDFVAALRFDPGIDYRLRRDIYAVMVESGFGVSASVLLDVPPRYDLAQFPIYELEEVPLGMRKWKARSQDRNLLDLMCHDHDHRVIEVLLQNPLLTQSQVLKIVTLRPQKAEVITQVLKNPKWAYRPTILSAIVLNPWTPGGLACALLPAVDLGTLKDVILLKGVHDIVINAARTLIDHSYKD